MLEYIYIYQAFQLAALAYTVSCVLTEEGYVLERYYDFLLWLHDRAKWLAYPLGYCEKCLAGQFGLWVWYYYKGYEYTTTTIITAGLRHVLFISFAILFTQLIKVFFKKWK